MMKMYILFLLFVNCNCYKILAIFATSGRSHHIFFSSLVEELASRKHDVTVINYHPVKNISSLHQISLQTKDNLSDTLDIEEYLKVLHLPDLLITYGMMQEFKLMANLNCKKLMENEEIRALVNSKTHFDVVIVEQFVSDCGLAIAHKLNAPTVGMTAHTLLPWTYSRLGAPSNPSFVPNHFFASGSKPNLFKRIKSTIIDMVANTYYRYAVQRSDQEIVNEVFPDVPDLEMLGRNMSLIMINQYYPLTGSRLYGANVVEIGGMHINKDTQILDKDLKQFLDTADSNGVVYISFGSIASNFPRHIIDEIIMLFQKSNMKFVWKAEISDWVPPKNVYLSKWLPQVPILCHPKVKAFISHSGMLSTSEAMHCGVPILGVPLFGDQFANAQSAVENGLGVAVDFLKLNNDGLANALQVILQDRYQHRATELSRIWKHRPMIPMDMAVFWIEHLARHGGSVNMRPPTVELPLYQYLMLDIFLVLASLGLVIGFTIIKLLYLLSKICFGRKNIKKEKKYKSHKKE